MRNSLYTLFAVSNKMNVSVQKCSVLTEE